FEAAGVVEAVGEAVTGLSEGDRVGYAYPPHGAYSQARCYPADRCVKLPAEIGDIQAAAMMLKGLTAQYLIRRTYAVQPGDKVLVHAASGGMGLILCQWCAALGATVIGTVSTRAKAEQAAANGCHHPVVRSEQSFVDVVKEVTNGEGVPVVYESIGKDTFLDSLDCLRPLGIMASYGHASGEPPDVNIVDLGRRGSLFVTRPAIMHYMAGREHLVAGAEDLFDAVLNQGVEINVNHTWPLSEVAKAHEAVENSRTTGSVVLLP
ncbi:MAG: quinone oxidoreductase, partial [Pseudomonadota bacterium]